MTDQPQHSEAGPHVLRAGSWANGLGDLRSASRGWNDTGDRNSSLGFRVACDAADGGTTVTDQPQPSRTGPHVLRGGSWDYGPRGLRSANRLWSGSGVRFNSVGFRVACDPTPTPVQAGPRVLRGSSWNYIPWFLRSANRDWYDPGFRYIDLGFRVACDAPAPTTDVPLQYVLRGSCWINRPRYLRSALRSWDDSGIRYGSGGFRVARDPHLRNPHLPGKDTTMTTLGTDCSSPTSPITPIEPEMMLVPGGTFLMGSPEDEPGRFTDEGPQHQVTLKPFLLGRHPVTFAQYDRFCDATGKERPSDEGWGRDDLPVINVSYDDAQEFCAWLRATTGKLYRLPSEAEWEYACRAGTTTLYWWGDKITPERANYGSNVGKTTPVGAYPANPWGLHDMTGNVWEWCADVWHPNYIGAPEDGSAWGARTAAAAPAAAPAAPPEVPSEVPSEVPAPDCSRLAQTAASTMIALFSAPSLEALSAAAGAAAAYLTSIGNDRAIPAHLAALRAAYTSLQQSA